MELHILPTFASHRSLKLSWIEISHNLELMLSINHPVNLLPAEKLYLLNPFHCYKVSLTKMSANRK